MLYGILLILLADDLSDMQMSLMQLGQNIAAVQDHQDYARLMDAIHLDGKSMIVYICLIAISWNFNLFCQHVFSSEFKHAHKGHVVLTGRSSHLSRSHRLANILHHSLLRGEIEIIIHKDTLFVLIFILYVKSLYTSNNNLLSLIQESQGLST
jgi:hypothetical protein